MPIMQCTASSWYQRDKHEHPDARRYGPGGFNRCVYPDLHVGTHKDSFGCVFVTEPFKVIRTEAPELVPQEPVRPDEPEPDPDDPTTPTMPLDEFLRREREDSNLWWRLHSGDGQNLLDEAVDRIDALVARTHVVVSRYTRYDRRVVTHVYGPYSDAQAREAMKALSFAYAEHLQVGEDMEVSAHRMAPEVVGVVQPMEVSSDGF